jgi:uncharacterized protein (DUF362 family)
MVKGKNPALMLEKALAVLGGIERFVAKGARVILKPNASWDRTPEQAANTNPELMGALTGLALKAGAREVIAFDHTIQEPRRCFARSGIGPAVTGAGGRIEFQGDRNFREVNTGGAFIGTWPVMTTLFDADVFINVPVVKSHGISKLTAAMKNLYGVVGGKRGSLHRKIDESIAELAAFVRPTLVVLDAMSVMVQNGPTGGRAEDLTHPGMIVAGTDQVALDAFAATLIRLRPQEVGSVGLAHERGLGNMRYKEMRTESVEA